MFSSRNAKKPVFRFWFAAFFLDTTADKGDTADGFAARFTITKGIARSTLSGQARFHRAFGAKLEGVTIFQQNNTCLKTMHFLLF